MRDRSFPEEASKTSTSSPSLAAIVEAFTGASKAKEGRSKTIADKKVAILNDLWKRDPRVAPWKNNAYGVLAAFNTPVGKQPVTVDVKQPIAEADSLRAGSYGKTLVFTLSATTP